jgi:hypothetical protein
VLGRIKDTKKERRAQSYEPYEDTMGYVERNGSDLCAL